MSDTLFSPFRAPVIPNMLRRKAGHDYKARYVYMITIRSRKEFGPLSVISGSSVDPVRPEVRLTEIGSIINAEITKINQHWPVIKIIRRIIMPDHIHFLVFVTERLERNLSYYINRFKGYCSRSAWSAFPEREYSIKREGVFEPGFNDKILHHKGQMHIFSHYIEDNPRRLLIKRLYPHYFHNNRMLQIKNGSHMGYGNFLLLDHPVKEFVVVSSKYTPEEKEKWYSRWREVVRQGGVLVGAFISEEEIKIKEGALKFGSKIIQIRKTGFGERYKPSERDLLYCANGQLLEIGYLPFTTRTVKLTRSLCLEMNAFAKKIAES